jgi:magnesium transporter
MLTLFALRDKILTPVSLEEVHQRKPQLVWVDLLNPTKEEEADVERLLATELPTREEMQEIELSSRLYLENGALHATATIVTQADTTEPETHAVTFMLVKECLITIRYVNPRPFRLFISRTGKVEQPHFQASTVFTSLLELIVDRLADILEMAGHNIDGMTRKIFHPKLKLKEAERHDFEEILQEIGVNGDLISKTRESMVSVSRLLSFILQSSYFRHGTDEHSRISTLLRDIAPLGDHANFLANKVNFLLDATLGMISIEQNATIKIFSVAAVVFLPPTLVASIYGMNFHFMPELDWHYGYPLALLLMLLSAFLPYKYFKRKKWL